MQSSTETEIGIGRASRVYPTHGRMLNFSVFLPGNSMLLELKDNYKLYNRKLGQGSQLYAYLYEQPKKERREGHENQSCRWVNQ